MYCYHLPHGFSDSRPLGSHPSSATRTHAIPYQTPNGPRSKRSHLSFRTPRTIIVRPAQMQIPAIRAAMMRLVRERFGRWLSFGGTFARALRAGWNS